MICWAEVSGWRFTPNTLQRGDPILRFIHTADWHLGRLFHGVHLTEDQAHILQQFTDLVRQSKPDLVIVAGDIYDRAVPPPDAVALLNDTVSEIVLGLKVPMLMIAGNHDSPERLGFGSALLSQQQLHMISDVGQVGTPIRFEGSHGTVDVIGIPYAEPAVVRERLGDEAVKDHSLAMRAILGAVKKPRGKSGRSILVTHAFVAGGKVSDSERPLSIGGAESVPRSKFAGFDYVALGHLHRPQTVGPKLHYSGSLLKYSFSEAEHTKSVKLVEMDTKGSCSVQEVSFSPLKDVRRIKGHLKRILEEQPGRTAKNDYLMVSLLDKGAILDAMGKLREVYPNVLHIERSHLGSGDGAPGRNIDHRRMSDEELFSAFFTEVTDGDLTSEQRTSYVETVSAMRRDEREADK